MPEATNEQQWAIDYKKKMAKIRNSIDPKVWDHIYGPR
jgi:hypothetical protein